MYVMYVVPVPGMYMVGYGTGNPFCGRKDGSSQADYWPHFEGRVFDYIQGSHFRLPIFNFNQVWRCLSVPYLTLNFPV